VVLIFVLSALDPSTFEQTLAKIFQVDFYFIFFKKKKKKPFFV